MAPRQLPWLMDLACRGHCRAGQWRPVWAPLATFDSTASMDLTGLALPQASQSPQPSAGVPPPSSGSAARLPALPGMRLVRYRAVCRARPPLGAAQWQKGLKYLFKMRRRRQAQVSRLRSAGTMDAWPLRGTAAPKGGS